MKTRFRCPRCGRKFKANLESQGVRTLPRCRCGVSVDEDNAIPKRRPILALWRLGTWPVRKAAGLVWWAARPWRWRKAHKGEVHRGPWWYAEQINDPVKGWTYRTTVRTPDDEQQRAWAEEHAERIARVSADLASDGVSMEEASLRIASAHPKGMGPTALDIAESIRDAIESAPRFSPGDRVRVNCEGCPNPQGCGRPYDGETLRLRFSGGGAHAGEWSFDGKSPFQSCPPSQLTKVEDKPWRPRVGEWVWHDRREEAVKILPGKDADGDPMAFSPNGYTCAGDGTFYARRSSLRPLRLEEVETEEQARQFYGRKVRVCAPGPYVGKIATINCYSPTAQPYQGIVSPWGLCFGGPIESAVWGHAEGLTLLEED